MWGHWKSDKPPLMLNNNHLSVAIQMFLNIDEIFKRKSNWCPKNHKNL